MFVIRIHFHISHIRDEGLESVCVALKIRKKIGHFMKAMSEKNEGKKHVQLLFFTLLYL